ncbi:low molecular weight phosphotyrosine protein phosphatase, partial [Stenotrophomonas geniculata]
MKLLVVCLGNICRSPMAEGALRARLEAGVLY